MIDIKVLASGSSGNCYLVSDGVCNILLDAGLPWRKIQELSGYRRIDCVLVSHSHADHSKGVAEALRMGIDVFMPSEMFFANPRHNAHGMYHMTQFRGKKWSMTAFDLQHDVECYGFVIDIGDSRIVYITDSAYCKYTFPNVSHWLLECNNSREILDENVANGTLHVSLRNRIVQTHASLSTVKAMLLANDLSKTQEIYLVHLSNDNSDAERFKREVQQITGKLVILA